MNFKDLILSNDQTHFLYLNQNFFDKVFIQAMKFHAEGLAAVQDESGWYHINMKGKAIYKQRYSRAFGYYFECATVVEDNNWFHIDNQSNRIYSDNYAWCGNYQEEVCIVRSFDGQYFHIDCWGKPIYREKYAYAGDYKDGYCCVRLTDGRHKHVDKNGKDLNGRFFHDLGVFHKQYATARDANGWFHIDFSGNALYTERYLAVEPFYNGAALVTDFKWKKFVVMESGFLM
jgi:hypothetical protein